MVRKAGSNVTDFAHSVLAAEEKRRRADEGFELTDFQRSRLRERIRLELPVSLITSTELEFIAGQLDALKAEVEGAILWRKAKRSEYEVMRRYQDACEQFMYVLKKRWPGIYGMRRL